MKFKKVQKFEKTFEGFVQNILNENKYSEWENLSAPNYTTEVDDATKNRILSVENFNNWLKKNYNYQKVDKTNFLHPSIVEDYFLAEGVECSEEEIYDFINVIKNHWTENPL